MKFISKQPFIILLFTKNKHIYVNIEQFTYTIRYVTYP